MACCAAGDLRIVAAHPHRFDVESAVERNLARTRAAARRRQLLARADVQAAVARVGRVATYRFKSE